MVYTRRDANRSRSGHAVIEFAFMLPWIVFLFIGLLDFGFFANAIITTQNAARVAALYTSSSSGTVSDTAGACTKVVQEMQYMPNIGSSTPNCGSLPLQITVTPVATGVDGAPASRVTVTYQTILMIPIPGILSGQFTFSRTAEFRVKQKLA